MKDSIVDMLMYLYRPLSHSFFKKSKGIFKFELVIVSKLGNFIFRFCIQGNN